MKDRQPTYPGRVKLVDVETGEEKLYDMTMADEPTEAGDPPTKATLLKDATSRFYGLGPDALPDDVLAKIPSVVGEKWVKIAEYKSAGSFEYTVQNGITKLGALIGGAGGNGGRYLAITETLYASAVSGGASGYFKCILPFNVTGGQKIPIVVGAPGGSAGNAGGSTSFNGIVANGGGGGKGVRDDGSVTAEGANGGQGSCSAYSFVGAEQYKFDAPIGGEIVLGNNGDPCTAQSIANFVNIYSPGEIYGAAGASFAIYGASNTKRLIQNGSIEGTYGKGGAKDQNATGNCNGGGAGNGKGSPGMVIIYALKSEALAAGVEIVE